MDEIVKNIYLHMMSSNPISNIIGIFIDSLMVNSVMARERTRYNK